MTLLRTRTGKIVLTICILLAASAAAWAYRMLAHAQTVIQTNTSTVIIGSVNDEQSVGVGTRILAEDYAHGTELDSVEFHEHMRQMADEQRQAEELRVEQELAAEANYETAESPVAERERVRRLFQGDGGEATSVNDDNQPIIDDAERARIRRLFEDQGNEVILGSTSSLSGADSAERERIRRLFQDQGDVRRSSNGRGLSAVDEAERERIRRLFHDQPDVPAVISGVGTPPPGRPARASCNRERSLLALVGEDQLFCSDKGFILPGLINGDCPMSACILKAGRGNSIDSFLGFGQ